MKRDSTNAYVHTRLDTPSPFTQLYAYWMTPFPPLVPYVLNGWPLEERYTNILYYGQRKKNSAIIQQSEFHAFRTFMHISFILHNKTKQISLYNKITTINVTFSPYSSIIINNNIYSNAVVNVINTCYKCYNSYNFGFFIQHILTINEINNPKFLLNKICTKVN